jgi:DNA polymerase elongation subunit (family B)
MAKVYTNVQKLGNYVLYRGVFDGKRVKQRVKYAPSLYLESPSGVKYKTLDGTPLVKKKFNDIYDARDYVNKFKNVTNGPKIYGNTSYEYAFIADFHKDAIEWDFSGLLIGVLDIEVGSDNGFPDPYLANEPITAITLTFINGSILTFGCGDYTLEGSEIYFKCKDEIDLCQKFLKHWSANCPDILTGWNIKFFDIPYLVNRFRKLLDEEDHQSLSPWDRINERTEHKNNRDMVVYELFGVSILDYLDLYEADAKRNKKIPENYRLDTIANDELGEGKLSFDEFDNLYQLYVEDYQKFIRYNIKDTTLVARLEEKLKLIELAVTLTYDAKCNFEDVFSQTRLWDALAYNYLLKDDIIVPPKEPKDKDGSFEGAYVKDVQVGLHEWVCNYDLDSLYPHLIMQYGISPETLVQVKDYTDEMREVLAQNVTVEKLLNREIDLSKLKNVTLTPSGQFFRTDIQGFLPKMMREMYADRKKYKTLMLQEKRNLENESDVTLHPEIKKRIERYNNLQSAKKTGLVSIYGVQGSAYFRFYDLRIARSITLAGQLSIKWIERAINSYMNTLMGTNDDYVIAMDTDSFYLRLGPLVNKVYGVDGAVKLPKTKVIDFMDKVCGGKIQNEISKSYQELADYVHAVEQKMNMKRECLADKAIWVAKKRYIMNVYDSEGVRYNEPDLKVVGLDMIKSSTPAVVRDKMKESVSIMINGTQSDMHTFISDFECAFKKLPPEDISFPRGVNGISKYSDPSSLYKSGTPIHVKGAILYNHQLKQNNLTNKYQLIKDGEKIKFAYLKIPNHFKDTVISFPSRIPKEFDLDAHIDYNMQFSKTFVEPVKAILDCIGWTTEKKCSLEDFFS